MNPPPIPPPVTPYGYQPPAGAPGYPLPPAKKSGQATASLVLGILSLFTCFITGIPAIIFGHLGLGSIARSQGQLGGKGMAVAGLVMGYIFTAGTVVAALLAVGTFPLYSKIMDEMKMKSAMKSGYQIHQACFAYASEHDETFPDKLDDLVEAGLIADPHLIEAPKGMPADFWEYKGKGKTLADDPSTVILVGRSKAIKRFKVVIRLSGNSKVEDVPISADQSSGSDP